MTTDVAIVGQDTFDYSGYDDETITLCKETAQIAQSFIHSARHTVTRGYELGVHLEAVKKILGYGKYGKYLESIGITYYVGNYWISKVKDERKRLDIAAQKVYEVTDKQAFQTIVQIGQQADQSYYNHQNHMVLEVYKGKADISTIADLVIENSSLSAWRDELVAQAAEKAQPEIVDINKFPLSLKQQSYQYATNSDDIPDEVSSSEWEEDDMFTVEGTVEPGQLNGSTPYPTTVPTPTPEKQRRTGGGGHPDGLLRGFYQIPTVQSGKQTYAIKEKNPPLDSGRRFYLAGVEHWPSGDNAEAYSYAFCESEIKGVTQAWIRLCHKLGIAL